jgi:hypothetical protein
MDANGVEPKEVVSASRKLGRREAAELVRSASRVIVAKGKKVSSFPGGKATGEKVAALLGPTGNLRAPIVRAGKTLLVGFDETTYKEALL